MSYLLDTHALLWWLFDDDRLSRTARGIIADPGNRIFASSASAWEIATKHRLGKLDSAAALVRDLGGYIEKAGFAPLPISIRHAQRAGSWPHEHRDPCDRMIAAQAVLERLAVITKDDALPPFGVTAVW